MNAAAAPNTPYEKLGGAPALERLTRRFYELMNELPEAWGIRQMHPEHLEGSQQSLFAFLSGWLGGPQMPQGRPDAARLRARHAPHDIGSQAREEWLLCMRMALAEQAIDNAFREALVLAFEHMAQHIVNDDAAHTLGEPAPAEAAHAA